MKFCTKCGTQLEDSSRFCVNCGQPTDGSQPQTATYQNNTAPQPTHQSAVQPKKKSPLKIILIILGIVVGIGLISTLIVNIIDDNDLSNLGDPGDLTWEEPAVAPSTSGEEEALDRAHDYLNSLAFSYEGLVEQLEYEGYSNAEATYAADNCGADWYQQALLKAWDYLESLPFSYSGLIDQLEYEGFTYDQAVYGADNCEADWYEEAARMAESYTESSSFTRADLIDQLVFEGFSYSEAEYGVDAIGY
ncbi:MAG: Ltp family lipoprotein [Firmicutes bacterium]|nr:Ltp family lipoprotein [Bacillota bacterium]